MDITEVILNDHHEQRRMFGILEEVSPDDTEALGSVWKRLRILLEVHAAAEEKLFYPRLLKLQQDRIARESPGEETEDAVHDHNEIRDAIASVEDTRWARLNGCAPWPRSTKSTAITWPKKSARV